MTTRPAIILGTVSACLPLSLTQAEGFRSPTIGTAGLANSGGKIAFIEDASAATHNPANLLRLEAWEASVEPTLAHHQASFRGTAGQTASTDDPWKFLPHAFAGGPVVDRVAAGVAITVPYGLAIEWDPEGAFRYSAPYLNELKTLSINPSVAYRLTDTLHAAVGLNVMWSELNLKQYYPWALIAGIPGLPDGEIDASGDGFGVGGNLGLTWEFLPRHRLAFTFRTPMDVDYEGDVSLSAVPTMGGGTMTTDFGSEIRFPTTLVFGYGFAITPALKVEANVEWLQFSRFEELPLEIPQPMPGIPASLRQDWEDTLTAGVGVSWQCGKGWTVRASYQYYETPVPEMTFSPSIPDAAQNAVTLGLGYRAGRHRFEAAYSRVFYEDREIGVNQNPAFIGQYEIDVHLISLAYGYTF